MLNIPSDYPLPNLYYFSSDILLEVRRELTKLVSILNQDGFEECHLPFLVPRSVLLLFNDLVSLKDYIIVYSGKNRRSYAYLRPDGIFSQGVSLAKKMIRSYRDLPLKLFEVSPGYLKVKHRNNLNIFTSPEQSFSIQGGLFTQDSNGGQYCQLLLTSILKEFSIPFKTMNIRFLKVEGILYFTNFGDNEVILARFYNFNQEIAKRANIYFFNKKAISSFPYMYTFSLSQNIFFLRLLMEPKT